MMLVVVSFFFFTLLVAIISWYKTRRTNLKSISGVFMAGRNNNYWVVAGSLLLTNFSANQLIGENESVYINNMSVMAWGVTSVIAMLIVSEFLFPVYFKGQMMTTADYLENRYDPSVKRWVSLIFLLGYVVNLLPPALYGGALAMIGMFQLDVLLGISYWQAIWLMVIILGLVGGIYTIIGGLRAITISDSILGGGLLIVAVVLPLVALHQLGHGSINGGIHRLLTDHKEHLNAIGKETDAIPFSTIFTGMLLVNIYYWGMEQYIVQQALAAKSLAHAQKGMALTAFGKLAIPVLINLPGLIAVHLYPDLRNTAAVFPRLAADVLSPVMLGLTAALIFGAALTVYNAGLHGSSTLFVLNILKPYYRKRGIEPSEKKLLRAGKRLEIGLSLIAVMGAPWTMFAEKGFYTYLQKVSGLFSLPVFSVIVVGLIMKRVPPIAAKAGLLFFMASYFLSQYVFRVHLHFLHVLAILFLLTAFLMWLVGCIRPMNARPLPSSALSVKDLAPWKGRHLAAIVLISLMVGVYLVFSKWGIAG